MAIRNPAISVEVVDLDSHSISLDIVSIMAGEEFNEYLDGVREP